MSICRSNKKNWKVGDGLKGPPDSWRPIIPELLDQLAAVRFWTYPACRDVAGTALGNKFHRSAQILQEFVQGVIGLDVGKGLRLRFQVGDELRPLVGRIDSHIISMQIKTNRIPAAWITDDLDFWILNKLGEWPDLTAQGKLARIAWQN